MSRKRAAARPRRMRSVTVKPPGSKRQLSRSSQLALAALSGFAGGSLAGGLGGYVVADRLSRQRQLAAMKRVDDGFSQLSHELEVLQSRVQQAVVNPYVELANMDSNVEVSLQPEKKSSLKGMTVLDRGEILKRVNYVVGIFEMLARALGTNKVRLLRAVVMTVSESSEENRRMVKNALFVCASLGKTLAALVKASSVSVSFGIHLIATLSYGRGTAAQFTRVMRLLNIDVKQLISVIGELVEVAGVISNMIKPAAVMVDDRDFSLNFIGEMLNKLNLYGLNVLYGAGVFMWALHMPAAVANDTFRAFDFPTIASDPQHPVVVLLEELGVHCAARPTFQVWALQQKQAKAGSV